MRIGTIRVGWKGGDAESDVGAGFSTHAFSDLDRGGWTERLGRDRKISRRTFPKDGRAFVRLSEPLGDQTVRCPIVDGEREFFVAKQSHDRVLQLVVFFGEIKFPSFS